MKNLTAAALAALLMLPLVWGSAQGATFYDVNITPDVIFGSGNANGEFTVDRTDGIELGLRAKVRYDVSDDLPKNVFNSNGDGTYNHAIGSPSSNPDRARWNFEWSVNTDYDGTTGFNLADLTYQIGMDFDPTTGTDFLAFDPIIVAYADHAIGHNGTGNGGGTSAPSGDTGAYAGLLANNNVAQNSWNLAFFDSPFSTFSFDPSIDATYSFYLKAFNGGTELSSTGIDVIVGQGGMTAVPEPSTMAILGLGLLGIGCLTRRKRSQA